jgi:hypothetical protein
LDQSQGRFNLLPNSGKVGTESVQQGSVLALPEKGQATDGTTNPKIVEPLKALSEPVAAPTEPVVAPTEPVRSREKEVERKKVVATTETNAA